MCLKGLCESEGMGGTTWVRLIPGVMMEVKGRWEHRAVVGEGTQGKPI